MGRASQALAVAALLLLAAAASPASARALAAIIGLPVETKDVQGQPVPLPSDAARKAASLPNGTQAEPVPLPGDAEKRAATGQPPAGPFGDPPPPPAPPADRQAERDRQLQAILAGVKPEVVIATLPGRGPCTRAPSLCRVRPCAPKAGGAPDKEVLVPVCPEPLYCLDDYCGGCNYICISAEQLRQAVDKIIPGRSQPFPRSGSPP